MQPGSPSAMAQEAEQAYQLEGNPDDGDDIPTHSDSGCSSAQQSGMLQSMFHLRGYEVISELGAGSNSRVYEVSARLGSSDQRRTHAAKVCDSREVPTRRLQDEYIIIQRLAGAAHCIQGVEAHWESPYSYIILEKCDRSVVAAIASRSWVSELVLAYFVEQCFKALSCLHEKGIVYGDVKPDEFMVVGKQETVKLIDFENAVVVADKAPAARPRFTPFMSPEEINDDAGGMAADVWSLGVILHALLLGRYPYEPSLDAIQEESAQALPDAASASSAAEPMAAAIASGLPEPPFRFHERVAERLPSGAHISNHAEELLRLLLRRDPAQRWTASQCLGHLWLGKARGLSITEVDQITGLERLTTNFILALQSVRATNAFCRS